MRGGYQIIDFKNIPIVLNPATPSDATIIKGVFDAINATRKPIMFTNVIIDSAGDYIVLRDFITSPIRNGNRFEFFDSALQFSFLITSSNMIVANTINLTDKIFIDTPLKTTICERGLVMYLDVDDTLTIDEETGKLGVTPAESDPET